MKRSRRMAALLAGALAFTSTDADAQPPPDRGRKARHQETRIVPAQRSRAARTTPATASDAKPVDIALAYVRDSAAALGLTSADVSDVMVTSELQNEHNGVTHVYLRQRFNGIEVHGAEMNVNVARDGRVFGAGNSFVANLADRVQSAAPVVLAEESVKAAARHLGKAPGATLSEQPVGPKLVYEPLETGEVVLGWHMEIDDPDSTHYWAMTIDAQSGEVLEQFDYTVHDTFEEPDWYEVAAAIAEAEAADATAEEGAAADPIAAIPVPGVPGSGTYRVWAWPHADPNDGDRSLAVDPADALSSPFGWHDTDGLPGAESTSTVGNNVDAYLDILNDNTAAEADRTSGGAGLTFDYPVDFTQNPRTYRPAATTNLFYWNNIIHDVTYRYGFTEAAGNFQVNHYGRFTPPAGVNPGSNDPVRAEAQDGGGMNNANFSTGNDGSRPRMQMFLWVPQGGYEVQALDGGAAGHYPAARANFGAFLADAFVTQPTAQVIATSPINACSALPANSLSGRIAFIEPGGGNNQTCSNVLKAQRAQDAGAIGVVLATNADGAAQTVTGVSGTITIPVLALNAANAALVRAALPFTAKLAFLGVPAPLRDGDFDAGVIIHEYGHGISNRLTGGRLTTGCLNNDEQMGEGWSDFLGLVLTHDQNRPIQRTRGMGPYIRFTPVDGPGIRTTRYSTDLAINPTTYGTTALGTLSIPHGIGYAWATALWDVYWNLIDKHGFNQNVYDSWDTGGNNLAIQLVIDGMKLQVCRPGFVNGRDAILQADDVLTGGANHCAIWRGFAKRGLGFSAVQGDSDVLTDNVEAFDMPPLCQPGISVAPAMLTATQVQEASTTQPLNITNSTADDGLDLTWTITEAASDCSVPTDLPWLSVSQATGLTAAGDTDTTLATFNAAGLDVGTYTGKLCIGGAGGTPTEVPVSLRVIYDFDGFGPPVAPGVTTRKAGAALPMMFSLNGFKGLDILAAGYPASRQVVCATGDPLGPLEAAASPGESALTYDFGADEYRWVWKTSSAWRNTCREFVVGLDDGTVHPIQVAFY